MSKAVTEAIPTHSMLTTATAKSSLQEIQSSFIWGDDDNIHHFHSVNWHGVLRPRYLRGFWSEVFPCYEQGTSYEAWLVSLE